MGKRYNRDSPYIGPSEAQAEALARRDSSYSGASGVSFSVAWNFHNREPRDLRDAVRMVRQAYSDEVPTRLHEGYDSIGEGGTPKMDVRAEAYLFGRDDAGTEKVERPRAVSVTVHEATMTVELADGRKVEHPIAYTPRLTAATAAQRMNVRLIGDGTVIHWPDIDEDLSVSGLAKAAPPALDYYRTPFRAALHLMGKTKRGYIVRHVALGSMGPQEAAIREGVPYEFAKLVAWDVLCGFLRSLSDVKVDLARRDVA